MEHFNYFSKANILTTFLLFFIFSFIGYLWETSLFIFKKKKFVNRGFLRGPWLPIYGYGVIFILFFLSRFIKKPLLVFFLIIVLCGTLEYITSFLLERLFHKKWWDYSECFLNLNGRICFSGLLFFGIGGMLALYFIIPYLIIKLANFDNTLKRLLVIILFICFIYDNYNSLKKPNKGKNISVNVKE